MEEFQEKPVREKESRKGKEKSSKCVSSGKVPAPA